MQWFSSALLLAVGVLLLAGVPAQAQSAATVVSATVPSAVSLTNDCTNPLAWNLGTLIPLETALTSDNPATMCTIGWSSSNDSAKLQIAQADRAGSAFGSEGLSDTQQQRDNAGTSLTAVAMPTQTRIEVGEHGGMEWSNTAGATWNTASCVSCTFPSVVHDIAVSPSTTTISWAVGSGGTILKTTDGGETWTQQTSCTASSLHEVSVVSDTIAWTAGRHALCHTTDGGATWSSETAPSPSLDIEDLSSADPSGASVFLSLDKDHTEHSIDGGATWTEVSGLPSGWDNALAATSASDIWAAASNAIFFSNDAGVTWHDVSFTWGYDGASLLAPAGMNTVYVAGASGTLVKVVWDGTGTNESDFTATLQDDGGDVDFAAIAAADTSHAVAVADHGMVDLTSDGSSWTFVRNESTFMPLTSIASTSLDEAVAVGGLGTAEYTTNGGTSWMLASSGTTHTLRSVATVPHSSPMEVWAVGNHGTIVHSTDGGASWAAENSGTTQRLYQVFVLDSKNVYAVGDGGTILHTADGGATWSSITTFPWNESLYGIGTLDGQTLVVSAGDGRVWVSHDAGATWSHLPDLYKDFGDVHTDPVTNSIWVDSDGEWFYVSKDGGSTWTDISMGGLSGGCCSAMALGANNSVVGVSGYSFTYSSFDDGATWLGGGLDSSENLQGIAAAGAQTFWAVGSNGYIAKVVPGGVAVPDYGGVNTWGNADPATSLFGVCLQSVGASATVSTPWIQSGLGNCTAADAPGTWAAVPAAPSTIATTATGDAGSASFVWGFRAAQDQPAGEYEATVTFTAIAPNV